MKNTHFYLAFGAFGLWGHYFAFVLGHLGFWGQYLAFVFWEADFFTKLRPRKHSADHTQFKHGTDLRTSPHQLSCITHAWGFNIFWNLL
jgi:hypothetical protein